MDWDRLRIFHAAAEAGSFSSAGFAVDLSQSAVSRHVTALERSLNTALFHRHARGLKLTEQGELLHGAVRDVIARVKIAEALLTERRDHPGGYLRISANVEFGAFWLAPRLNEFHELYPDIIVTLLLDGGRADLAMLEADVAIRMSLPEKAALVQRRIFSTSAHAYVAPAYLRKHGIPTRPEDLDHHRLIVMGRETHPGSPYDEWLLRLGTRQGDFRQPAATVTDVHCLYQALLAGFGIGALPSFVSPERAGLVRVIPDCASPTVNGYFVYPLELKHSKRVEVFRDFLIRKLSEERLHVDPSISPSDQSSAGSEPPALVGLTVEGGRNISASSYPAAVPTAALARLAQVGR